MIPLKVMQGRSARSDGDDGMVRPFSICGDAQATRRNDPTRIARRPEVPQIPDANRDVNVFLDKIDVAIGQQHAHVETRVGRKKFGDKGHDLQAPEADGGGDGDCSGQFLGLTCYAAL